MENNSIGQYRSHDPPRNFAIKVTFWKVTTGSVIPSIRYHPDPGKEGELHELNNQGTSDNEKEEITIKWQQKLFNAREFDYYADPLNCTSSVDQKYHEDVNYLKSTHGDRINKRIFTYVDSDTNTFLNEFNQMTLSPDEHENILSERVLANKSHGIRKTQFTSSGLRRRHIVTTEPTQAMKNNRVTSTPVKTMKIMADVSSRKADGILIEDERVLCTIKINANGLIVMQPDIGLGETHTIEAYHEIRSIYNFKLEHASIPMSTDEIQQESRLFNELYNRHAQLMGSQVGSEMTVAPKQNQLIVCCFAEIVSAKDFEYDGLYVTYLLDLPDGWVIDNADDISGVTHRSATNKNGVANFSFTFEFLLTFSWDENDPPPFLTWPTLFFEVYSLDSWKRHRIEGYGFCQIPDVPGTTCVEIDTWRPKGESSTDEMQRFFIGGTPELNDLSYIKDPTGGDEKVNKFYFKTLSTGSVIIRLNTVFQTKLDEKVISTSERFTKWKKTIKRTGGFAATVDSMTQVLDAFQRARKRMLEARATLPSIT